ncbi:mitotic checkpoint protein BUB3.3-like [Panicum miliaceum]|uniref:Mitotic checkpoint protein BUB3.3-like n=1 Tax=Panicum miliaceum TaxID=4540 RepID=A0A3L6TNV1_PANMI|nr:mitotic checkpoint protein BUB3.3-like [Panicum miliaceum]
MARRSLAGGATAGAASRVRFAPTSNNLLVSSWDSGLRLYDADTNTLRFKAESEPALLDCCFEDESAAFACCSDGSVRRYDFRSVSQDTVGLHEDAVACVEYSQTTGYVAGSVDGVVALNYLDDVTDGNMGKKIFVTGDDGGYAIAWDGQSKKKLLELPSFSGSVASMAYNHSGQLLAVAPNYHHEADTMFFGPAWEMSDSEEHHFESKADAGASKTYPQQAGTIRKNGYIVIKGRPCKVVEVSTSKTGKHGHAKCHFVAIDIFNGKKLEDIVPSSHNCDVPHVNRTDYQLIDISEDGFVSLLTENGGTKDDLRLPTDEALLSQIKAGFDDGKDLIVSVMSAMGEEQICGLKDIGKN